MSSTLYRLARACYRARKRVLAAWLVLLAALGVLALTVRQPFDDAFRIPGANSQVALDQLKMTFPEAADSSATMLVLVPPGMTAYSPVVKDAIAAELDEIEKLPFVKGANSPYNKYVEGMVSDDQRAAQARIRVEGSTSEFTDAQREQLIEAAAALQGRLPGSEVRMGGEVFAMNMPHLSWVEAVGLLVALVVLVFALGSVGAALIPLLSAILGVGLAVELTFISTGLVPINSTTLMLAIMLGLAVGIDYSLFVVSRHRHQLAVGEDTEESAARASATAGSAVVFAGLTVIIALAGLAVAGIPFLTTMGGFAAVAVAFEVALSLTLLPAMLGFYGDRLRPKSARRPAAAEPPASDEAATAPESAPEASEATSGRRKRRTPAQWWVDVVTARPIVTVVVVVLGLGALAYPARNLELALPNSGRSLPGASDRVTFDLISQHFGVGFNGPLVITAQIVESKDPLRITDGLRADIEALPGVQLVATSVPNRNADTAMVQVIPTTGPDDPATAALVRELRAQAPTWKEKYGVDTAVTGFTAIAIDVSDRLAGALLPFGIFVVGLSLVLLTMVFRSIWVPVKAVLGYLLSVGAAFGATQLVFNQGIGRQFINLAEPMPIISFLPIMLMGILFGLAMDYEVFLTSRMREEYVHGNRTTWVQEGFVHSATVVVAAALIMFAVFAFFVPEGEGAIKPIAFGLAIGVAVDAFVVRMTFGPAVMQMLGRHAWWLPGWLAKRLPVLDIEGEALTHQLSLADWPSPDAPGAVYAEGLTASYESRTLFSGVDLSVDPGQTLLVLGPERDRTALLLALSGRLVPTAGAVKVLGYVVPEQNSEIRQHVTFVDGDDSASIAHLGRLRGPLLVVDHADRIEGRPRDRLAALASDLGDRALLLGAARAESVQDLVGDGVQILDLSPGAATPRAALDPLPVGA